MNERASKVGRGLRRVAYGLFGLMLLVVAIGFGWWGFDSAQDAWALAGDGVRGVATVIQSETTTRYRRRRIRTAHENRLEWADGTQSRVFHLDHAYEPGAQLRVTYGRSRPSLAVLGWPELKWWPLFKAELGRGVEGPVMVLVMFGGMLFLAFGSIRYALAPAAEWRADDAKRKREEAAKWRAQAAAKAGRVQAAKRLVSRVRGRSE